VDHCGCPECGFIHNSVPVARTYLVAILCSSSLCHKTPSLQYLPCIVSGKVPLLALKETLHSLMVRSLLPRTQKLVSLPWGWKYHNCLHELELCLQDLWNYNIGRILQFLVNEKNNTSMLTHSSMKSVSYPSVVI
jgi:hypothetical protein